MARRPRAANGTTRKQRLTALKLSHDDVSAPSARETALTSDPLTLPPESLRFRDRKGTSRSCLRRHLSRRLRGTPHASDYEEPKDALAAPWGQQAGALPRTRNQERRQHRPQGPGDRGQVPPPSPTPCRGFRAAPHPAHKQTPLQLSRLESTTVSRTKVTPTEVHVII